MSFTQTIRWPASANNFIFEYATTLHAFSQYCRLLNLSARHILDLTDEHLQRRLLSVLAVYRAPVFRLETRCPEPFRGG